VEVFNPAFDVTPARLVDALVTERGVVRLAQGENLEGLFAPGKAAEAGFG
jgi:methylthioribose-1-phosphate isomerase